MVDVSLTNAVVFEIKYFSFCKYFIKFLVNLKASTFGTHDSDIFVRPKNV